MSPCIKYNTSIVALIAKWNFYDASTVECSYNIA